MNMVERINYLAKKEKESGLTAAEKAEQATLRREYIDKIKKNLRSELSNVYTVDDCGVEHKLKKKD